MRKIKNKFIEEYKEFNLYIAATNISEVANEVKDSDYLFYPIDIKENKILVEEIIKHSFEVNSKYLLPKWSSKPATDQELINTAQSYLNTQFLSSKSNIKGEIPLVGEVEAKSRFSQLLKTYLPIFILYITYLDHIENGFNNLIGYLSWDESDIFLPLPIDYEYGIETWEKEVYWDNVYEEITENTPEIADPATYDTKGIEELIENLYNRLSKELNDKINDLKNYIDSKLESDNKIIADRIDNIKEDFYKIIPSGISEAYNKGLEEKPEFKEEDIEENPLKEENIKLKNEIESLKNKIEVLSHDNKDLMKSDSEHSEVVSEFQDEIKDLKNKIKLLNEDNDKHVKRDTDYGTEVAELKQEIADLKEELEKSTDEDIAALIAVKDNEIAELKQELETRQETEQLLRDRNAELEEGDNSLRKELNKVNEENTSLTRKLAEVQQEITDKIDEARELEREVDSLTATNKELSKEIEELNKELELLRSQNGSDELENLREDNRILRQALNDYKNKEQNKQYLNNDNQVSNQPSNEPVNEEELSEEEARKKAAKDRIGRMIYGDAYDGTQTF